MNNNNNKILKIVNNKLKIVIIKINSTYQIKESF